MMNGKNDRYVDNTPGGMNPTIHAKTFGSKVHIKFLLFVFVCTGVFAWFSCTPQQEQGPIYTYNKARDRQQVIDLFKANWYWLIESKDFSTEFMLDYAAPNKDPKYMGHFNMRVMRENDQLAGFLGYYKKSKDIGWLLFLVIDEKYRGQGRADILVQYAIDQMRVWGVKKVRLLTRASNIKAQKVYLRNGFKQYYYDPDGFVYFEYAL